MAPQEAQTDDLRAAIDHEVVRPHAADRGLVVELLWGSGETTADVRIRRVDAGT